MSNETPHTDVHVIGGGLAGLIAAATVARAGRTVTVHEGRGRLGGRNGFRFNQGPHAFFRSGAAGPVLAWQTADHGEIRTPAAWLTTVTTRPARDRLTSARARRETYVGPRVPDPLVAAEGDPSDLVAFDESLSLGFQRVLETLAPVERAVFLLHDVFAYPFDEVATAIGKSAAATRQIARRARDRARDGRPRVEPEPPEVSVLSDAFLAAVYEGDVDRLAALLTHDITYVSDGGGNRHAARRTVHGPEKVARLLVNLAKRVTGPGFETPPGRGQRAVRALPAPRRRTSPADDDRLA